MLHHLTPRSRSISSHLQRILRIRRSPAVLRYAGLEPVLELSGDFLEIAHTACAGGLSSFGFHAPIVCVLIECQ